MSDPTTRFVPGGFPTDLARRIVHTEDVGPQPDEMVKLQMALDAAEHQIQSMIRENDLLQANLEIAVGGLRVLAEEGDDGAKLTLCQMGLWKG